MQLTMLQLTLGGKWAGGAFGMLTTRPGGIIVPVCGQAPFQHGPPQAPE